jgi:methionyl-tRNA formyltransferase
MKIVLWIGNDANQKALANKIHAVFPVAGIVMESKKGNRKITMKKIVEKAIQKLFLSQMISSWWGMLKYYQKLYPSYPVTRILDVENINSKAAYDFTKALNADLIIVSGTRMIKQDMLSLNPAKGIMNLHTGLSPYIKGGPNCTNWCIASQQYHLIGNTVMWIDRGIDSGNIITTDFTPFNGSENLSDIHIKVMEHAHELYLKAISFVAKGNTANVKQDEIASGTTYYTRQWTLQEQFRLIRNVKNFQSAIKSGNLSDLRKNIRIVSI